VPALTLRFSDSSPRILGEPSLHALAGQGNPFLDELNERLLIIVRGAEDRGRRQGLGCRPTPMLQWQLLQDSLGFFAACTA
jgi:hypothetical protein